MAAAGRATGVWDRREQTFSFQMPPGITKAYMEFSGIPGHYKFDFDTAQCTGSFVTWGDYDFDYESDRFQMDREFSRCHRSRPRITNHPFRRLNHRLETYNPARPWTVSPRRRRRTPPRRARTNTPPPPKRHTRSRSVSFARNIRSPIPGTSRNATITRSPVRPVNVNIVTPAYTTPLVRRVRTPTPPRPAAPPPYSPPSPIYQPDPTPSPPRANIVNSAQCSGGSVSISPQCPRTRTGASVYKSQSALTPPKSPNVGPVARQEPKLWENIQKELPKELSRFCKEATENIGTYSDLVDFAVKCDVPITWIDRAKEDNPNDSQSAINQVFYEWWDRSHLNLASKLRTIMAAFRYMGKPAIFNRIVYTCPDVEMLLDHVLQDTMPPLFNADSSTGTPKPHSLESVEALARDKIKAGKITTVQHDLIHLLSEMITSRDHYETLCESLEMPPEYGESAKPRYETWMLQTEATLIKFYIRSKSYLFIMARLRTAFNACGFLMYCDEVFVSLGHRISAINDFARVNDPPPNEFPSAESGSNSGDDSDSPRKRRDSKSSAEISDDERRQPHVVASTSKENDRTPQTPPNSSNKTSNTNSPTATAVFEFEDTQNEIQLSDENIQGIVTLRMERNAVKGETRKEVLERLMPKVLLRDIKKGNKK